VSEGAATFCKHQFLPAFGNIWYRAITANEFVPHLLDGKILSIDKAASLTGGRVPVACFDAISNLAPPIVLDASPVAQFLSTGVYYGRRPPITTVFRKNLMASPFGVSADTIKDIPDVTIPPWFIAPPATQPNGQGLMTASIFSGYGDFQSASIQSRGAIWNVHTIGLGGYSRIRMYKLDTSGAATAPLLVFTPKTSALKEHLFNPSFATGSGASTAPAFITASRTIPSLPTNGRAAFIMFMGLNSSASAGDWSFTNVGISPAQYRGCLSLDEGVCPWGPYSATQVDPSASGRAWGFNQLATGVKQYDWRVRAGEVELNLPSF
jgi:hypothetical protein